MNNLIKKLGGTKGVVLIVIALAVLAIFGMTMASGGGHSEGSADHGHSHD